MKNKKMTTENVQLLVEVIKKVFEVRQVTGIAIDINLSMSYLVVDFIFYSTDTDIEYTHIETISLDCCNADKKLKDVLQLLNSLKQPQSL